MKPEWMDAIKAPNPETIVDRLNGIYPSALGPYKASPLEKEAAGEILRLRELIDEVSNIELLDACNVEYIQDKAEAMRATYIKNAPKGVN